MVELVIVAEFGMDELGQGQRDSPDFSTPLKLNSMLPISIKFTQLTLEGLFAVL